MPGPCTESRDTDVEKMRECWLDSVLIESIGKVGGTGFESRSPSRMQMPKRKRRKPARDHRKSINGRPGQGPPIATRGASVSKSSLILLTVVGALLLTSFLPAVLHVKVSAEQAQMFGSAATAIQWICVAYFSAQFGATHLADRLGQLVRQSLK